VAKWHKWGDKGKVRGTGISRLLGVAKLQSAPSADNPHYATDWRSDSMLKKLEKIRSYCKVLRVHMSQKMLCKFSVC